MAEESPQGERPFMEKRPFDVDVAMERLRAAVAPYPPAALFELADDGYRSAFEQVVACILSVRTLDEVSGPTARRLFAIARTPAAVAALCPDEIETIIQRSSFHEVKARQIHAIARRVADEYGGECPCDEDALLSFPGVGPKCAHLVLGIACGRPSISVDVHVHRVTNRWGIVHARTPEQTMVQLQDRLPLRYWIEINRLLVPFGKHVCTARLPRCSTCPLLPMCLQAGVTASR
jgi:endonuclease-3